MENFSPLWKEPRMLWLDILRVSILGTGSCAGRTPGTEPFPRSFSHCSPCNDPNSLSSFTSSGILSTTFHVHHPSSSCCSTCMMCTVFVRGTFKWRSLRARSGSSGTERRYVYNSLIFIATQCKRVLVLWCQEFTNSKCFQHFHRFEPRKGDQSEVCYQLMSRLFCNGKTTQAFGFFR